MNNFNILIIKRVSKLRYSFLLFKYVDKINILLKYSFINKKVTLNKLIEIYSIQNNTEYISK